MNAISIEQLLTLARAYSEATGVALTGVGQRACGNNKVFIRLAEGHGANVLTCVAAAQWFAANWPADAPWPDDVPRSPGAPPAPAKAKSRRMAAA
jgi:hypothetical protein